MHQQNDFRREKRKALGAQQLQLTDNQKAI
jgi:hypothetical protein